MGLTTQRIFGICSLIFGLDLFGVKTFEGYFHLEFPPSVWVFATVFTFFGIVFTFAQKAPEADSSKVDPSQSEDRPEWRRLDYRYYVLSRGLRF